MNLTKKDFEKAVERCGGSKVLASIMIDAITRLNLLLPDEDPLNGWQAVPVCQLPGKVTLADGRSVSLIGDTVQIGNEKIPTESLVLIAGPAVPISQVGGGNARPNPRAFVVAAGQDEAGVPVGIPTGVAFSFGPNGWFYAPGQNAPVMEARAAAALVSWLNSNYVATTSTAGGTVTQLLNLRELLAK